MKTIKMLSVACTVVFALAALSASAATAHEWQLKGKPLSEILNTKETATYKFIDEATGASFNCTFEEKGTIGLGAEGKITSVKEESCQSNNGFCETTPTMEALKLPWSTKLVTYEGGVGNEITTKTPEWKWSCRVLLSSYTEYCAVDPMMETKNVAPNVEETAAPKRTSCLNATSAFSTEKGGLLKEATFGQNITAV